MSTGPDTKRVAPTYATEDQLKILKAAFDRQKLKTSVEEVKALSEQTGLTRKWITSWLCRQRRRIKIEEVDDVPEGATPAEQEPKKGKPKSQKTKKATACEPKALKIESEEPLLTGPGIPGQGDIEILNGPPAPTAKKPRGRPKGTNYKRKAAAPPPDTDPQSRKRPAPATQQLPTFVADYTSMQNEDSLPEPVGYSISDFSSNSPYVRVPVPAELQHVHPVHYSIAQESSSTYQYDPFNDSTYADPINQNQNQNQNQNYAYSDYASLPTSVSAARNRQIVFDPQDSISYSPQTPTSASVTSTFPFSFSVPPDRSPAQARAPLHHLSQNYPLNAEVTGPDSGPSAPLLSDTLQCMSDTAAYNDLGEPDLTKNWPLFSSTRAAAAQAYSLPRLAVPQSKPSPASDKLLGEPEQTPLKHLSVLQPLNTVKTPDGVRAIFDREAVTEALLDDRLVREDPFQAAMGLVFLRSTGLSW